jgi:hypothetical protein
LWAAVCPVSGSGLSPACHQSFCLSSLCLLKVHVEISSLPLPSSLVCLQHPTSSAVCSFSISCLFNFFWWGGGGSFCPGGYAGLSQGWLWEYHMLLICSPVGLLDISQAGLELASGDVGALLFSQCNVARRSFVRTGSSGCRSPESSCAFFCQVLAPVCQQGF